MEGWIQLHRSLREWEWFTDVNTSHLFIYCLLRANHKDTKWRGISIGRGQFVTSLDTISKETGLSVMQVRTAIKKLELTKELTNQSTNINRLITITNYDKYQSDNKPVNKQVTSKQQTSNKAVTTDNNENNNNNENNIITIPSWLPIDDWNDFLEMRNKNKSPPTDKAKQMLITKLHKLMQSGNDPSEVLQQSTMNNYKGIFEVKQNGKQYNNAKPNPHDDFTKGIALGLAELNKQSRF